MKKVLLTVLAGAIVGMFVVPALAADDAPTFTFNGEVRARYEYLNNYFDLTDNSGSSDPNDDSYAFAPYRVMIGMTGNFSKNVSGHVDLQYVGMFGDEQPSKDFFIGSPVPPGQVDEAYQFATQGVQLYTGWIDMAKVGGTDLGFRLGRQEHTYGTELFLGDNDYYAGLSFDGLNGRWQRGNNDLNFFYYKTWEDNGFGITPGPGGGSVDSDLFGATYDYHFNNGWGTVGGYLLFGQDLGGNGVAFFNDSSVITYGARWNREMMNGDKLNMFDWNIEAAFQSGDEGAPGLPDGTKIDVAGYIIEGWFGFNFKVGDSHGRVHIGTLITSGDDFNTADKDEGFVTYYGDFHAHNRFGDLDWVNNVQFVLDGQRQDANITDFNIGYEHWFGTQHYVMAAYHMFNMTESNGAPSDKLGDEIDLTYDFIYSKNLTFETTLGQAMPGEAAENLYGLSSGQGDPVQRFTLQAKLSW